MSNQVRRNQNKGGPKPRVQMIKENQVKKVRFDSSQQWRLNRVQLKVNGGPNRKIIQKNLSAIKNGETPLKRAQAAYYGNQGGKKTTFKNQGNKPNFRSVNKPANRSPLLVASTSAVDTTAVGKLPVHARLGDRPVQNESQKIVGNKQNTLKQMLAQKRALRLKAMQQNNEFRQLKAMGNKKPKNTLRSDQVLPQSRPNFKPNQRNNFKTRAGKQVGNKRANINNHKRVRGNANGLNSTSSAADLCVSVSNDLALKRQISNGITVENSNRRRLNRHMNEINPQIQREISLIQERSRRMNIDPSLSSVSGLSLRTANPIHSLQTDFIQDVKPDIRNIPLQHLGGITTSISLPQENRQKLSLHERFSLL